jgi:hypothetical protein
MATVKVPGARATISESPEGLLITIPAMKNWFLILFLGFWLIGWLCGEVTVIFILIRGHLAHGANLKGSLPVAASLFMLVWLSGWTLGGGFALLTWLWNFAGVELIVLGPSTLATKREVLGIGPPKEYDLQSIGNLRVSVGMSNFNNPMSQFQTMGGGTIAFDYAAKTFRFGIGLDEAEARQILARFNSRHSF